MDFGVLLDTAFDLPLNSDADSVRLRSSQIDEALGFDVAAIEEKLLRKARLLNPHGNVQTLGHSLHHGNQTWVGLDYQTLQTPYAELWEMLELLPHKPHHVVDLGAGYGRMALVLHKRDPDILFTGFELVGERVLEGKRVFKTLGVSASLIEQDLMDPLFQVPMADIYFIYDFGKVAHIRTILDKLAVLADHHHFRVIARGKGSRSLIDLEYPWLSQIFPAIHRENYSIYSMNP
jgi:hypothetical protein